MSTTPTGSTIPPADANRHTATGLDPATGDGSVQSLVKNLATDVSNLLSSEMALARAEIREAANEAKAGIASMAIGGVIAIAGCVVVLMAAMYGLDRVLPLWLAALVTGGVALMVGGVLLKSGQAKFEPGAFVPDRTQSSLQKDKEFAKRKLT